MILTNRGSILVLAGVASVLVGCDSIRDVRDEPSSQIPPQTAVLEGTVTGVSSKRSVTLANGSQRLGVLAAPPSELNESLEGLTSFSFGTVPVGTAYNVTVAENPAGKSCSVVSGGSGTLAAGVKTNVVVECLDVGTRYSMTVSLDPAFAASPGAQVVLTTEEAIYRANPVAGQASVTFADALFNPSPSPAGFSWSVTASNTAGGTQNKCPVTNPTNAVGGNYTNPTADITNVSVGACSFTIGGSVAYSLPSAGAVTPPAPTGLVLELRDLAENSIATQAFDSAWGSSFLFSNQDGSPAQFQSNRAAIYTVAVNTHPDGMRCVVSNPTAILYAPTLTSNPTRVSTLAVHCRELPAQDRQLRGVFRHMSTVWKSSPAATAVDSTWNAFDFSNQNTASSNMIALFENGTFIYGTHAGAVQVEHGFYDFDPNAGTLTFTLNADTNSSVVFPTNFSPAQNSSYTRIYTTVPGMSALPGSTLVGNVRQVRMTGVDVSTAGRISGTFSGCQYHAAPAAGPLPACASATSRSLDASISWVLEAPASIPAQMSGAWLAQDSRRLWVFDRQTYYGTHVGVAGVYTMNDACFTMPDLSVSSGIYTRRPSTSGCYPWPRPATGQTPTYLPSQVVESVDFKFPQYIAPGPGQVDIGTLQNYMARIPGGMQAADGRSPSPMMFHISSAAQFYDDADPQYFPAAPTSWCETEILGIRATLNGVAMHQPIYFCRFVP